MTSVPIIFELVDSSNAIIPESPAIPNHFTVSFEFKAETKGRIVCFIPLFNFSIPSTGPSAFLKSRSKIPSAFRPKKHVTRRICNNDTYLNNNGVTAEVGCDITFHTNGDIIIEAFQSVTSDNTFTNTQGHCILSTIVGYKGEGCKSSERCNKENVLKEKITWPFQLALADSFFYQLLPVAPISYDVKLKRINRDLFLIRFPTLTFVANDTPSTEQVTGFSAGNLIKTYTSPLPEYLRPKQNNLYYLIPGTFNDAVNPPVNVFAQLSIDIFGNIVIQNSSVTNAYAFAPGTYSFNSKVFYYSTEIISQISSAPVALLFHEKPTNPGFSDVSQFTSATSLSDSYRDSHTNDSYKEVFVKSWSSNQDQVSQAQNSLDVYFQKSKLDQRGTIIKDFPVIRLTNNAANVTPFDTAVAINRKKPKVIMVTYSLVDRSVTPSQVGLCYRISQDGGKTFAPQALLYPMDLTLQKSGDARGVIAGLKGEFWISLTTYPIADPGAINLTFLISKDFGATWTVALQTTDSSDATFQYDYPQIAVGPSGLDDDDSGLWYVVDVINGNPSITYRQKLGYISSNPIITPQVLNLPGIVSTIFLSNIAVDCKGGVYVIGDNGVANTNVGMFYKKPGPLDLTLFTNTTTVVDFMFSPNFINQVPPFTETVAYPAPITSIVFTGITIQSLLIDDKRDLIYVFIEQRPNENTQKVNQYMIFSSDKGRTWSGPVFLPKTSENNRGFISSFYNKESNSIQSSWYDAINSLPGTGLQYYEGFLTSNQLDALQKDHCEKNVKVYIE